MNDVINTPISNCKNTINSKQFLFSFIILLLCCCNAPAQTIAGFSINKSSGCVPLNGVSFTDNSSGSAVTSRDWDLGNGTVITNGISTVTTNYATAQKYYITLRVTFANGDIKSVTDSVTVFAPPVIKINGDSVFCINPTNNLQYTSTITCEDNIVKYKWMIDADSVGNAPNLNYNYRFPGTHFIKLFVTTSSGCTYNATQKVVIDYMAAYFTITAPRLCGGGPVTFANGSMNVYPIASYLWDYGDGTTYSGINETHTYTAPGNYTVKLTAVTIAGCRDSISFKDTIKVLTNPTVQIDGDSVVCLTPSTTLQYNSTITTVDPIRTFKWSIDGGPTIVNFPKLNYSYNVPGTHDLTFTIKSSKSCEVSVTKTIEIDSVKAGFSLINTTVCGSSSALFNNLSKSYGSSINKFIWTYGDGTSLNGDTTSHTYSSAGTYTVKLYAETIYGCKDSTTIANAVNVYDAPSATINGNSVICLAASSMLHFISNVTSKDAIAAYKWMIDGDSIAITPNLDYDYRIPGKHTLTFEITTINGCSFSTDKDIIIDSVKTGFSFSDHEFCGSGTVHFTNISTHISPVLNYSWTFGDNSFSNDTDVIHSYNSPGNYSVKLYGITENGCADSTLFTDTIHVFLQPTVSISGDSIHCKPGLYQYNGITTAVENIETYKWYADNIPAGSDANLEHYFNAGTHTVSLKVTTLNGCSDSASKQIIVDSVKAGFSINKPDFCGDTARVIFTNNSAGTFNITKYDWSFGDNSTSSLTNPEHTYLQPGVYSVTLITTTEQGCTDTVSVTDAVHINKIPGAAFAGDKLHCSPGNYNYLHTDLTNDVNTIYEWKVNGAIIANSADLNYNFPATGLYDIALKVTSDKGCGIESSIRVVIDSVNAGFTIDTTKICGENGTIHFTNTSSSGFGNTNYTWSFGDGQSSADINPVHFYNSAGKYGVSLKAVTVNGCSAEAFSIDSIKIYSVVADITGADEKCMQQRSLYTADITTLDNVSAYSWKLNNVQIGNADTVGYNFSNAGSYDLQLDLQTEIGCAATVIKKVIIHALPAPNASADTTICRGSTIQLRSFDGTIYQWDPAPSLQNANSSVAKISPSTTNRYFVTVTNQYGCTQKDSVLVTVDQPTGLNLSQDKKICIGDKTQLKATANAASFLWSGGEGLSSTSIAAPFAQPSVTSTYQVIAYSSNVCKNDTGHITISVGYIPKINAGADRIVEANEKVQLGVNVNTTDITEYNWQLPDGLNCNDCPNPTFNAVKDITYTVAIKTSYGCTASDDIHFTVVPAKPVLLMPTAFSPNNDGLNDRFYVKGYGLVTVKSMIIFNNWGQKVFEKYNVPANDPSQGWDGGVKGEPAGSTASFVYILSVITKNGEELHSKGSVVLVR